MTRPLVSTLTVAASVASVLPPIDVGSTYAADAHAEVATLGERGGLLLAERLVVEDLERLLQRLERGDLLEHVAGR